MPLTGEAYHRGLRGDLAFERRDSIPYVLKSLKCFRLHLQKSQVILHLVKHFAPFDA